MSAVASPTYSARNMLSDLPLDRIEPSPLNPRRHFDDAALEELAASIAEHGLIEPIVVRTKPGSPSEWWIVAGERRYRACKLAGLETVPARNLGAIDDSDHLRLALVENLHRQDLDPIEEAEGYAALHRVCGLKQAEIAAAVNRSQPAIANAMRLLELPPDVLEKVRARQLTPAHGRALVRFAPWPALCQGIAERAIEEGWTSKRLEGGFGNYYDGIKLAGLAPDLFCGVEWQHREAAVAAGLTLWGNYTPDVARYRELVEQREAERKAQLEAELAAGRAAAKAAQRGAPVEITADHAAGAGGDAPLPGRDPETKNGRRRLKKDAERAERDAIEASALPKLESLPYGSYERVSSAYGQPWPEACGPDCDCRAKAIDRDGTIVDISTRPRHVAALRSREARAIKEGEKRRGLELGERLQIAIESAPAMETYALAIAAAHVLTVGGYGSDAVTSDVGAAAIARYVPHAPKHFHYISNEVLDALAAAPAENLVRLMVDAILSSDVHRLARDAGEPPRRLTWYLVASEGTAAVAADTSPAPGAPDTVPPPPGSAESAEGRLQDLLLVYEIFSPDEPLPAGAALLDWTGDLLAQVMDEDTREEISGLVRVIRDATVASEGVA